MHLEGANNLETAAKGPKKMKDTVDIEQISTSIEEKIMPLLKQKSSKNETETLMKQHQNMSNQLKEVV